MARRIVRPSSPSGQLAINQNPDTPRPTTRRRVPPDQSNPEGPHWYRGATPWNDLTSAERKAVEEAAANSVKFWEGPSDL
jgi:hypothetical protein